MYKLLILPAVLIALSTPQLLARDAGGPKRQALQKARQKCLQENPKLKGKELRQCVHKIKKN